MKKLYISILLLLGFLVSFGQSQPPVQSLGNANNIVVTNGYQRVVKGGVLTSWADTTAANGDLYLKYIAGIKIRTGDIEWQRSADLTRWFQTGAGSVIVDSSNSVILSGNGSSGNPLTANIILSSQQGNALQSTGQGLFVPNFVQDGIIQPGVITWIQNYDYDVSPAIGVIGGVQYTSAWTPITLATADPTNDRIDLVVFNAGVGSSTGTITVITGTPAADPQQPTLADPSTQLAMAFILVTANTTQPPTPPTQDWIYINNAEWTTLSSTARIDPASTIFPYSVPLDVRGGLAQNNDNIRFTSIAPPTISNFNVLTLKIRAGVVWAADSKIGLRWHSGPTPIGSEVAIANGSFGFTSTNILTYQIVSIPLYNFGSLASVTNLLMTVRTTGGRTISFYIDDIQLQQGIVPSVSYTASQGVRLVGSDFQLGGSITQNINITTTPVGSLSLTGVNSTKIFTVQNSGSGRAITSQSAGETIYAVSTGNAALVGVNNSSTLGSVETVLKLQRTTNTAPSAGIGGAIEYMISPSTPSQPALRSNRLISSWTDEGIATRTSEFKITGVLNAVESDLFTLSGTGALKLNKYTTSAFTGTPVNTLQTDASGNIIQGALGIITANNALTITSTNVQFGGPLVQTTTVSTAGFGTTWTGANTGTTFTITNTSSGGALYASSTSNTAVSGVGTTGKGGAFQSTDGNGMEATTSSATSAAGSFNLIAATTSTVRSVMDVSRLTSGTAANGIGGSIDFNASTTVGGKLSNQLISKWTDATDATRTSQFILAGVNSAVTADLLTISGTGATRLNKYGIGTFTGTPAKTLQIDASGNIIEGLVGGTADNGLTANSATNVQLGATAAGSNSPLLHNTWINNPSGYSFTIEATSGFGNALDVNHSGGNAIQATSVDASGLYSITTNGTAIVGQSTNGLGALLVSNPSSTNTTVSVLNLRRSSSGTPANNIAGAIEFSLETTTAIATSNTLISKWTTADNATRTSQFIITGVNSASTSDLFTLSGSGSLKLNKYGVNTFAGVAAYVIGVDASGSLVEVAAAGAGMTNVLTTTGDIIYSSSGTTPARLGIGSAGQVLTVVAGIPAWTTVVGTGSVTDFIFTDANGVDGTVTTSTTTPTLSLAFTPNGMLKSNGTTLSAATSGTDYSAGTSALATGILKSTTTTGALTIAVAGDFPTLNQNTTGSAATLTTSRNINGVAFNGSADITVTAAAGTLTGTTLNATVVTSSLTAVGTITTGVWQGTAIGDTYISSASTWNAKQAGDATLTALAGLTITNGSIIYGTGADAFAVLAAGTNGHVLTLAGGVPTWAAAGSGTVTNVSGTSNRITVATGTTTPVIDISSSYVGQTSITTLGTIGTGTWQASAVGVLYGGTGQTSYTNGQLLIGNTTGNTLTKATLTGTSNQINVTNGAGSITISHAFNPTEQVIIDGATLNWDVANGGNAVVTLGGTGRILANPTNLIPGYTYTFRIIQGSGGSKTITTWTNVKWSDGTVPTLSTTAGAIDVVRLYCVTTTNLYGTFIPNIQ